MTRPEIVRVGSAGLTVLRLPGDPDHYVKFCASDRHADDMRAVIAEAHALGNGLDVTAQRRYGSERASRPCYVTPAMAGRVVHPLRISDEMALQAVDLWQALQGMTRAASLYSHVPAVASLLGRSVDGRWCHGDFDVLHMYWDEGRLVGVIDFDAASFADGRFDLAMLIYSIVRHRPPPEAADAARRLAGRIAGRTSLDPADLLAWTAGIARHRFQTIPGTQHIGPAEAAVVDALWESAS